MILRQFSLLIYSSAIARLQMASGAYLLRLGYSAYPAAIRGDLMRCADPERIATLAADHRDFVRLLPRERMCGAKDRTRLRACGRERVIDFDG